MALITCNKCGKKISDTVSNCIHCGALIKETAEIENQKNEPLEDKNIISKIELPNFDELSEDHQIALENEFLKSDKRALKYKRKGVEMKKYATLAFWLLLIGRLLLLLQKYVIQKFFNGEVYKQEFIDLSEKFILMFVFIWIASIVMCLYTVFSYKSKLKKHIYNKKFQNWLKEKKNIKFTPSLISEKDRIMFEQIDINTMNC